MMRSIINWSSVIIISFFFGSASVGWACDCKGHEGESAEKSDCSHHKGSCTDCKEKHKDCKEKDCQKKCKGKKCKHRHHASGHEKQDEKSSEKTAVPEPAHAH